MSKATSVASNTAIFLADSEEMKLSGVKSGERGTDPMAMLKKVIDAALKLSWVHEWTNSDGPQKATVSTTDVAIVFDAELRTFAVEAIGTRGRKDVGVIHTDDEIYQQQLLAEEAEIRELEAQLAALKKRQTKKVQ